MALAVHVAQLELPPKLYEAADALQASHCGPAVPDGHHAPTHAVAPGPDVVVFDGHVKHVEVSSETAPRMPNELAGHTGPPRHGALAPTSDENKPGLHAEHCALAADVEPKGPTFPTAHGAPEQRGAAADDHVPETQIEQEFDVVSMVPLGPEKPAAHMQVAAPVVFVKELAGQVLHVAAAADVAPSGPDELNAQGVPTHPSDAVALAKVPEGHAVHAAAALELAPAIE